MSGPVETVGDLVGYYPESKVPGEPGWAFQKDAKDPTLFNVVDYYDYAKNPPLLHWISDKKGIPIGFPRQSVLIGKCSYSLKYLEGKLKPYEEVISRYDEWIKSLKTTEMDKMKNSDKDNSEIKNKLKRINLLREDYKAQYVDTGKEYLFSAKAAKAKIDKLTAEVPVSSALSDHLTSTFNYSVCDYATLKNTGIVKYISKSMTGTYSELIDILEEAADEVRDSDEYKDWKYKQSAYKSWKEKYANP